MTNIGYCVSCRHPACPTPERKKLPRGECREWRPSPSEYRRLKIKTTHNQPTMSSKLCKVVPRLKSKDDQAVAAELTSLYRDANDGVRRIVAFGIYAWHVKLELLKHGQFLPWLKAYCPDVTPRTVQSNMALAESALHHCGVQIRSMLRICQGGKLLLLEDAKVPEKAKPLRDKLLALIEGKSASALFAEFKQAEEDVSGQLKPKIGRLKGQGGATKDQRHQASEVRGKQQRMAIEAFAESMCHWIREHCNDADIGTIAEETFELLTDHAEHLWGYCRHLRDLRRSAKRGVPCELPPSVEPSLLQTREGALV